MTAVRSAIRDILGSPILVLLAPQLTMYYLTSSRETIIRDVRRWAELVGCRERSDVCCLLALLANYQEFRNLYYYRIRGGNRLPRALLRVIGQIYRASPTLFFNLPANAIGPGLFIQHGFATIIAADSIGTNCWINQQVTIGFTRRGVSANDRSAPKLGNNVQVTAGAKVLGPITIGDNVIIGANAVVLKDVPDNCTVVGVPARIVREDGIRLDKPLS